ALPGAAVAVRAGLPRGVDRGGGGGAREHAADPRWIPPLMEQAFPSTQCRFGVARRDLTPPVGIYPRRRGAATHDGAEGRQSPCSATAAVFAPLDGEGPTLALVGLDLTSFPNFADERALREAVLERTGLDESELLIQMSHTHSAAYTSSLLQGRPG